MTGGGLDDLPSDVGDDGLMGKEYFYFAGAPDREHRGLTLGLAWLFKRATPTDDGIVVMPSKAQFGRGYGLAEVIGEPVAKKLGKGESVATDAGIHLRGYTAYTFPKHSRHGPVLAIWLREDALTKVADCDASALCVVPFVRGECEVWARGVGALDLGTAKPLQSAIHDPLVSRPQLARRVGERLGHGDGAVATAAAAIRPDRAGMVGRPRTAPSVPDDTPSRPPAF